MIYVVLGMVKQNRIIDAVDQERHKPDDECILDNIEYISDESGRETSACIIFIHSSEKRIQVHDMSPRT